LTKNNHGIDARVAHIRQLARRGEIDVVVGVHTNGSAGARGTMIEYLNAHPQGQAAEGNPLGRALATAIMARLDERCRLPHYRAGVLRMAEVQAAEAVGDLVNSFEHWSRRSEPASTRERFSTEPAKSDLADESHSIAAEFETHPFPEDAMTAAGQPVLRLPVALVELGSHDLPEDAPLLARNWFRRRAGEGVALGVDAQLRADQTAVVARDVRAVLARLVGETAAVAALRDDASATTPQSRQAALDAAVLGPRAVGAPAPPDPGPGLAAFAAAARTGAGMLTRDGLATVLRTALAPRAGWAASDDAAEIMRWVQEPWAGAALARGPDVPTRAEAAALACRAIGLAGAGVTAGETRAVGPTGAPLLGRAANARGALFTRAEALRLAARLADLRLTDVQRVSGATLTDGAGTPLDTPRGSGRYALHRGTVSTVFVDTAGAAWKTVNQLTAARRHEDAELRLTFEGRKETVRAAAREPTRVTTGMWVLDWPSTAAARDLRIELWLRVAGGWTLAGATTVQLQVLPTPPP
jgi:N-acetylmuramoyl-L-alanine amidase